MNALVRLGKRITWFVLGLPLPSAPMSLRTLYRFGRKLPVFVDQHTSRKIYWRVFERLETKYFLQSLQPTDVCLDVGANIGYYTALFASRASKVVAIDPVWQNASLIRLAQAINRDKHVEVLQVAVGHTIAREEFVEYQQTSISGLARLSIREEKGVVEPVSTYTVDVITIDSLGLERLDVVKMDIEGGEFGALQGMSETFRRTRPRLIMLELVDEHLRRAGHCLNEVLQFMDNLEYDAKVLGPAGLVPFRGKLPRNDNFFFTPR